MLDVLRGSCFANTNVQQVLLLDSPSQIEVLQSLLHHVSSCLGFGDQSTLYFGLFHEYHGS
jgi:hypothetical protein